MIVDRLFVRALAIAFALSSEARRTKIVRLAPSLAAALPEDLFEHPQNLWLSHRLCAISRSLLYRCSSYRTGQGDARSAILLPPTIFVARHRFNCHCLSCLGYRANTVSANFPSLNGHPEQQERYDLLRDEQTCPRLRSPRISRSDSHPA